MHIWIVRYFGGHDNDGILSHHQSLKGAYQYMRQEILNDFNVWFEDRVLYGKSKWIMKAEYSYSIHKIEVKP